MTRDAGPSFLALPATALAADRHSLLRWARRMNGDPYEPSRIGGVVCVSVPEPAPGAPDARAQAQGRGRRYAKSITSGEVRWFPRDATDEDGVEAVYEWAREEIVCAFQANVDLVVVDEIGPEVIHHQALDSALRACLWRAAEERVRTRFLVVADPSVLPHLSSLYNVQEPRDMLRFDSLRDLVRYVKRTDAPHGTRTALASALGRGLHWRRGGVASLSGDERSPRSGQELQQPEPTRSLDDPADAARYMNADLQARGEHTHETAGDGDSAQEQQQGRRLASPRPRAGTASGADSDAAEDGADALDGRHAIAHDPHHGTGPFYSLARFPLLLGTLAVIFAELLGYVLVRQAVRVVERLFRSNREAWDRLGKASSYPTWRRSARQLDMKEGKSGGTLAHVPVLMHHSHALARATRHLVRDAASVQQQQQQQQQRVPLAQAAEEAHDEEEDKGVAAAAATDGGSDESLRSSAAAAAAMTQHGERDTAMKDAEEMDNDDSRSASTSASFLTAQGGADADLLDLDLDPDADGSGGGALGAEHEVLSSLRACATSLNELVSEQLYAMNHTGTNTEMRQLVGHFLDALDEVDACAAPEALNLQTWAAARVRLALARAPAEQQQESVVRLAERALEGVQRRLWRSPVRATLARLRNSSAALADSPAGRAFLSRVGSLEAELSRQQQQDMNHQGVDGADAGARKAAREQEQQPQSRGELDDDDDSEQASEAASEDGEDDESAPYGAALLGRLRGDAQAKSAAKSAAAQQRQDARALQAAFFEAKQRFFCELAHTYGETALCLSGGAGNAFYHLGVIRCLLDRDMLPRFVTGASGGALVGAYVCTKTDAELRELMRPEVLCKVFDPCSAGWLGMLRNLWREGTLFNLEAWISKLKRQVCGTLTFREAFERTGRQLLIPVYNIDARGKQHTRVLSSRTTPDVVIFSAVLASSALPKLLPPIELLRKDARGNITPYHSLGRFWRDGSFQNELPFEALRQLFNVTFTVVSQVEPHLSPFFYSHRGAAAKPIAHGKGRGWRGGFALAYVERLLKLDLRKWLELVRDFNLMPHVFETDISSVFLGRTRGNVTVVPPIRLWSYVNLVSDPDSPAKMRVYMRNGQRMAWPALGMLQDRLEIERRLEELANR